VGKPAAAGKPVSGFAGTCTRREAFVLGRQEETAMAEVQDQDEHGPVLTVIQARGALRGRHMAWVLGVSMALIVVAFSVLWLGSASGLAGAGGQTTIDSTTAGIGFKVPPPQPRPSDSRALSRPGIG
jgi:hypothetical protein